MTTDHTPHDPLRPAFHPAYLRLLCAFLERQGADGAALLALAGLDSARLSDDGPLLPLDSVRWFIHAAERVAGRPTLALEAGRAVPGHGGHGLLGEVLALSPTLRDAVTLFEREMPRRSRFARVGLEPVDGGLAYVIEPTIALGDVRRFVLEHMVASTAELFRRVAGATLDTVVLEVPWPAPPWQGAYRGIAGMLRFGARRLVFHLPDALLDRPRPGAAPTDFGHAERALAAAADADPTALRATLERWLDEAGAGGLALTEAAARLGLSTRTVIRRLRAQGISYQELVDAALQAQARVLLRQLDLPLAEVARRLGQRSPSNLSRLCRRWFGVPPSELRRQAAVSAPSGTR
jgi:AraC-like DNA-binding protein